MTTTSPLLTSREAAEWLRLCAPDAAPDQCQSAIRSVHRLVQTGKLRPVRPGREYVFAQFELERYVHHETEGWGRDA